MTHLDSKSKFFLYGLILTGEQINNLCYGVLWSSKQPEILQFVQPACLECVNDREKLICVEGKMIPQCVDDET